MNIKDAVKIAHDSGTCLYRKSKPRAFIILAGTEERGIISYFDDYENKIAHRIWKPRLDDLLAEDWFAFGTTCDDSESVNLDDHQKWLKSLAKTIRSTQKTVRKFRKEDLQRRGR